MYQRNSSVWQTVIAWRIWRRNNSASARIINKHRASISAYAIIKYQHTLVLCTAPACNNNVITTSSIRTTYLPR